MTSIATLVTPLVRAFVGERPPVRFEFWDGSVLGPDRAEAVGTINVMSAKALRRILYAPNELDETARQFEDGVQPRPDPARLVAGVREGRAGVTPPERKGPTIGAAASSRRHCSRAARPMGMSRIVVIIDPACLYSRDVL